MRRFGAFLAFLTCASALFAQQTWEGTAAVSSYGVFPSSGLYGASNSFPQNTLVNVKNLDNGKQTSVLIIDRVSESGLFLLLSNDAGAALGVASGGSARVEITLPSGPTAAGSPGDLPYSPDSDINPAAGVGNPSSLAFLNRYLATTATSSVSQAASPAAGLAAGAAPAASAKSAALAPSSSAGTPEVPEIEPLPTPPVNNGAPKLAALPAPVLRSAGSAPSEDLAGIQPPQAAALSQAGAVAPPTEIAGEPRVLDLSEPAAPRSEPLALSGSLPVPASAAPAGVLAASAAQAVPSAQTAPVPVAGSEVAAATQPTQASLPAGVQPEASMAADSYYVQLASFFESGNALSLAASLSQVYPVSVFAATTSSRQVYRVLVGPLKRDESGALLYQFIALGYRDAFLRKVN